MTDSFLNSFFSILHLLVQTKQQVAVESNKEFCCPQCGSSMNDIVKMSRLGCENCYEYYKKELLPIIMRTHKSIKHTGKRPKNICPSRQIKLLEEQMKLAVEKELYESAKEIKDKIAQLKLSN